MNKITVALMLLTALYSQMSLASFLDSLQGHYEITGTQCEFANAKKTGEIFATEDGVVVRVPLVMADIGYETELDYDFRKGSGKFTTSGFEGEPIPVYVVKTASWKTDEKKLTSTFEKKEGVPGFRAKTKHTLRALQNGNIEFSPEAGSTCLLKRL